MAPTQCPATPAGRGPRDIVTGCPGPERRYLYHRAPRHRSDRVRGRDDGAGATPARPRAGLAPDRVLRRADLAARHRRVQDPLRAPVAALPLVVPRAGPA